MSTIILDGLAAHWPARAGAAGGSGPATDERRAKQSGLTARLLQTGPWNMLPEDLKNHILVIILGAQLYSSWRLILQDVIWPHAPGARPVLVQGAGQAPGLCGQVNQELVTLSGSPGERAVALSGVDGQMMRAHATDPLQGGPGQVYAVNPHLLEVLCAQGSLPIVAPSGQRPEGTTLLIDVDRFAAHLACALDAEMLVALDNAPGVQRPDGSLNADLVSRLSACLGALVAVPHALLHLCLGGLPGGTGLLCEPDLRAEGPAGARGIQEPGSLLI